MCTTSSYLYPWVKVLRQQVSLSLSAWCLRRANRFYETLSFTWHVNDTVWLQIPYLWDPNNAQTLCDIQIRAEGGEMTCRMSKWSVTNSWFNVLPVLLSVFMKPEQTNSALFWCVRGILRQPDHMPYKTLIWLNILSLNRCVNYGLVFVFLIDLKLWCSL